MQFIYSEGVAAFVTNAARLASQHGTRFDLETKVLDCIAKHAP
jgi:hypothetical protein